jgi:hypothetical protein
MCKKIWQTFFQGESLDPGPTPPDFSSQLITLVFPAAADGTELGQKSKFRRLSTATF